MVRKADILIENYRPGVMDRLGLGYDVLKEENPRLIYAAISGFGSYGPYAQRPGYDIISQAMGGLMSITGPKGSDPTRSGNAMGDILGGMQQGGVAIVPSAKSIIPTAKRVLETWRAASLPVIFKVRVHRPDGIDVERFRLPLFREKPFLVEGTDEAAIFPELQPAPGEYLVHGARFSGFFQTDLQLLLTRLGIETLVVCGMPPTLVAQNRAQKPRTRITSYQWAISSSARYGPEYSV